MSSKLSKGAAEGPPNGSLNPLIRPPGKAALLAEKIKNSQAVIFPDVRHFFPIEIPQTASAALIRLAK